MFCNEVHMKMSLMAKVILVLFILCIIAVIIISAICRRWIKTVRVRIIDNKISSNHRLVLISDLHNCTYGKNNEKLCAIISNEKPEYVLIAGDLLVHGSSNTDIAIKFLKNLTISLKNTENISSEIIYIFGNHELRFKEEFPDLWKDYLSTVKELGVHFLDDASHETEDIFFSGYTNKIEQFKKFRPLYKLTAEEIYNSLPKYSGDKCNFLIAHNPEYFDAYLEWGADRVVGGHLHGGIVRLPFLGGLLSPQTFFGPKYYFGTYYRGNTTLTVSAGIGDHTIPLRLFNRRDITVIELIKKEENQ